MIGLKAAPAASTGPRPLAAVQDAAVNASISAEMRSMTTTAESRRAAKAHAIAAPRSIAVGVVSDLAAPSVAAACAYQ